MDGRRIKIAVMGCEKVGKTSIIRRFSGRQTVSKTCTYKHLQPYSEFVSSRVRREKIRRLSHRNAATSLQSETYYSSAYCKEHRDNCTCKRLTPVNVSLAYEECNRDIALLHLSIIDVPYISSFPKDTFEEWSDEETRGVRDANVYILVFDITQPHTFQYVKRIRSEIIQAYKVNQKNDTEFISSDGNSKTSITPQLKYKKSQTYGSNGSGSPIIVVVGNKCDKAIGNKVCPHINIRRKMSSNGNCRQKRTLCRIEYEYNSVVRKSWKCLYIQCSAKFDYNVSQIFHDIIKTIQKRSPNNSHIKPPKTLFQRLFSCCSKEKNDNKIIEIV